MGSFEFSENTKKEVWSRQKGRCAHCECSLNSHIAAGGEADAHHVVPQQSGDRGRQEHEFLRTSDNGVYLCEDCHNRVHEDGKFRDGAGAPPEYYKFSHGRDAAGHEEWKNDLNGRADEFWRDKAQAQQQSNQGESTPPADEYESARKRARENERSSQAKERNEVPAEDQAASEKRRAAEGSRKVGKNR